MKKSELTKLLETLKDDDDIDETVSKSDLGKALASSGLTLDAFKNKAENDKDFKAFMDSEKDKHSKKALETWKTNNLQKLIDDEYYKKHPDDKPKDPLLAKALEDAKKANERADQLEKENLRKDLTSKALKTMTEKKLPTDLVNFVVGQDEDTTKANLKTLTDVFSKHDEALKTEILKGSYKPGGQGGAEPTEETAKAQINSVFGIK